MPRVVIFKETLLPPSETFILAQMQALRRFEPVLAGLERACPTMPLPLQPIMLSARKPLLSDIRAKLYRRTGVAAGFHQRVRRVHPRLVHAHFASGGRSAVALARALGVPLVVTLHGADVTVRRSRQPDRQLFAYASKFLCVSEFIRQRALQWGFPEAKLCVHHIGIDRSIFSPSENAASSPTILFVGRLVEKKGCAYLLRAVQQVQQQHPQYELMIIGDGPLRPGLEALARELKVRCQFRGSQPPAVVREAMSSARLFCLPSVTAANGDSEGLPTVLAEAQAMGIPVVSTTHAGIPEIITDGVNGLLAPERDASALGAALLNLLGDEQRWWQFRRAALRTVELHFDLRTQTAQLERIYNELICEGTPVAAD